MLMPQINLNWARDSQPVVALLDNAHIKNDSE